MPKHQSKKSYFCHIFHLKPKKELWVGRWVGWGGVDTVRTKLSLVLNNSSKKICRKRNLRRTWGQIKNTPSCGYVKYLNTFSSKIRQVHMRVGYFQF